MASDKPKLLLHHIGNCLSICKDAEGDMDECQKEITMEAPGVTTRTSTHMAFRVPFEIDPDTNINFEGSAL
jgi:hypothetical protein